MCYLMDIRVAQGETFQSKLENDYLTEHNCLHLNLSLLLAAGMVSVCCLQQVTPYLPL